MHSVWESPVNLLSGRIPCEATFSFSSFYVMSAVTCTLAGILLCSAANCEATPYLAFEARFLELEYHSGAKKNFSFNENSNCKELNVADFAFRSVLRYFHILYFIATGVVANVRLSNIDRQRSLTRSYHAWRCLS